MTEEPLRALPSGVEDAVAAVVEAWNSLTTAREAVGRAQAELRTALRDAFDAGVGGRVLSEQLGVSPSRIYQLRRGA